MAFPNFLLVFGGPHGDVVLNLLIYESDVEQHLASYFFLCGEHD
jgi:hypothetical protein